MRRITPIAACLFLLAAPLHAQSTDPATAALTEALTLIDDQNWDAAAAAATPAGALAEDLVEWSRLRAGDGLFGDYVSFLRRHPDWPGLDLLHRKGEAAITTATPADQVVAYFKSNDADTAAGSLALQAAYQTTGNPKAALAEAKRAWVSLSFADGEQASEVAAFGKDLAPLNAKRLDGLLWAGKVTEAKRMLPLVSDGEAKLAAARIALQTRAKGVDATIAAVPAALAGDAGLAHDRFDWRYDKGNYDDAADLLLQRSTSAKALGQPAAWAANRAQLVRRELRGGDARKAYRMAANDYLTSGGAYADLEFLAGYIALTRLNDPKTALVHFRNLRGGVNSPISLSRAAYWQGRAEEALGNAEGARVAYDYGATFQTAFYGLLSAEKAGLPLDPALLKSETFPDWHNAAFMNSSVLKVALMLQKAGDRTLSKRFFLHLGESLDKTGLGQLSDLALALHEPHIAVLIAKQAAQQGIVLPRAYFPVTDLARANLPIPTDLALAIARRESEFDEAVVSPAGARGLMQVMPATAQRMSDKAGLDYDKDRLTQDAGYNATLGSTYLKQLIDQFGPALTLVAAGYNAGPNRATQWIAQLGDPRAPGVDPVDWIEAVPFTETRDYIMRVAESYEVYRGKLEGKSVRIRLTEELKGQQ